MPDLTNVTHDPDYPYIVADIYGGFAKFSDEGVATRFASSFEGHGPILDTSPKPRVPDDADGITWLDGNIEDGAAAHFAFRSPRNHDLWELFGAPGVTYALEDLPGVTDNTEFRAYVELD